MEQDEVRAKYNKMLDELKQILDDFDNEPNREQPEAMIKGEGEKIEENSDVGITIYEKLLISLNIFYREYEDEIFHKKQN